MITVLFLLAMVARLYYLRISRRNEQQLLAEGAREYGVRNTRLLIGAHLLYYFAALAEGWIRGSQFDVLSGIGVGFILFSMWMLHEVIARLGKYWTVKLYIHPNHEVDRSWLFAWIKHPNYYLCIVPELMGIGLLCHAWTVMMVGVFLYSAILAARIQQEEEAMKHLM